VTPPTRHIGGVPIAPPPPPDPTRRARAAQLGMDRTAIFVPAVMSVGLLFWLLTALRDVAHARRARNRARRAAIAATVLAGNIDNAMATRRPDPGLRPRPLYLVNAVVLLTAGCYVAIGAYFNYVRAEGYVSDIAWLLVLSLAVALAGVALGATALVTFVRYPTPPAWTRAVLHRTAMSGAPGDDGNGRPGWQLSTATFVAWVGSATLSLVVQAAPHVVDGLDGRLAGWIAHHRLPGPTTWLDLLARPAAPLALVLVALVAARRCPLSLATGLAALLGTPLAAAVLRSTVARPRPPGEWAGGLDSYPYGAVILPVLAAGLVPMLLSAGPPRRWVERLFGGLGATVAVALGYHAVATGRAWPTDVAGGLLLATSVVCSAHRTVRTAALHRRCPARCPHRPPQLPPARRPGLVPLPTGAAAVIRLAAHLSAAAAATGLVVLSFTRGVPTNPEGPGLGLLLERPAQIGLAALVSIAALLGWRRPAAGAVLLAVAATGLGVFAGVEYQPAAAVALTVALMIPAVLLWLSWQHRHGARQIVAVALVTAMLVTGTWVGASTVYDGFFGPTHPASTTPAEPVDRVAWLWSGGLTSRSVVVVARLAGTHRQAALVLTEDGTGAIVRSADQAPDSLGLVRLPVDGLTPGAGYRYRVEVDGRADTGRGHGRFTTPAEGPMSFRVAVASCARTASNGAVFDAIAATEPLLYLEIGDLHYENLEATAPGPFVEAFGRALGQPAQAALARQVPMTYVWDDHDYGPNDAGADSPTRAAAQAAYRAAVPYGNLPAADGAVNQAFTIGRVRFVLSDGRSGRTEQDILDAEQERWLVEELTTASRTHALVVWANGTPWIGAERTGADTWAGAAAQRRRIADALAAAGIDNLVMVAGDAHMVAIDDGTNSGYAADGSPGFPVLQAAALDRPGSLKGGPYSEGAFPGGGQFGLLDITDHGDRIEVRMAGRRWDGSEPVSLVRSFPVA